MNPHLVPECAMAECAWTQEAALAEACREKVRKHALLWADRKVGVAFRVWVCAVEGHLAFKEKMRQQWRDKVQQASQSWLLKLFEHWQLCAMTSSRGRACVMFMQQRRLHSAVLTWLSAARQAYQSARSWIQGVQMHMAWGVQSALHLWARAAALGRHVATALHDGTSHNMGQQLIAATTKWRQWSRMSKVRSPDVQVLDGRASPWWPCMHCSCAGPAHLHAPDQGLCVPEGRGVGRSALRCVSMELYAGATRSSEVLCKAGTGGPKRGRWRPGPMR